MATIQEKAEWLKDRIETTGTFREEDVVTFSMPILRVRFDKKQNKYFVTYCNCKFHRINGTKIDAYSKDCAYKVAVENSYKIP